MESIEKLREALKGCITEAGVVDKFDTYWITASACDEYIDEIEAEIAERYMELPLDADGVPIRIGDAITLPNGQRDRIRFFCINANGARLNERGWVPSACRHVKPRTVEDVLEDFAHNYNSIGGKLDEDELWDKLLADTSAELREMITYCAWGVRREEEE